MKKVYVVTMTDGYDDIFTDYVYCVSETMERAVELMNECVDDIIEKDKQYGTTYIKTVDGETYVHVLEDHDLHAFYEFEITPYEIDKVLVNYHLTNLKSS